MEPGNVRLDDVLSLAKRLTPLEKAQLIERIMPDLEASLEAVSVGTSTREHSLRSAYGLCSDLGEAPSAEDIDEVRREIFESFPREDV